MQPHVCGGIWGTSSSSSSRLKVPPKRLFDYILQQVWAEQLNSAVWKYEVTHDFKKWAELLIYLLKWWLEQLSETDAPQHVKEHVHMRWWEVTNFWINHFIFHWSWWGNSSDHQRNAWTLITVSSVLWCCSCVSLQYFSFPWKFGCFWHDNEKAAEGFKCNHTNSNLSSPGSWRGHRECDGHAAAPEERTGHRLTPDGPAVPGGPAARGGGPAEETNSVPRLGLHRQQCNYYKFAINTTKRFHHKVCVCTQSVCEASCLTCSLRQDAQTLDTSTHWHSTADVCVWNTKLGLCSERFCSMRRSSSAVLISEAVLKCSFHFPSCVASDAKQCWTIVQ